jgi:hypothetical protein
MVLDFDGYGACANLQDSTQPDSPGIGMVMVTVMVMVMVIVIVMLLVPREGKWQ